MTLHKCFFSCLVPLLFSMASPVTAQLYRKDDKNRVNAGRLPDTALAAIRAYIQHTAHVTAKDTLIINYNYNKETCWDLLDQKDDAYILSFIKAHQQRKQRLLTSRPQLTLLEYREPGKRLNKIKKWDNTIIIDSSKWLFHLLFAKRSTCGSSIIIMPDGEYILMRSDPHAEVLDFTEVQIADLLKGSVATAQSSNVLLNTVTLFDSARSRPIPLAIYQPSIRPKKQQVVVVSHGYGQNKGGDYLAYSYLTEFLAGKGYFVASIQHELPTDSLIPSAGIPQIVRRPFWERGADNILFVINELKRQYPTLDFRHINLIGHSNGGDMTALFPQKYPGIVDKIITLDNRRMALPRTASPHVYSLRSSDQPADEGVLPTAEEQKQFGIKIITLPNTIHNDMDNSANAEQRKEINQYILTFLKGQ